MRILWAPAGPHASLLFHVPELLVDCAQLLLGFTRNHDARLHEPLLQLLVFPLHIDPGRSAKALQLDRQDAEPISEIKGGRETSITGRDRFGLLAQLDQSFDAPWIQAGHGFAVPQVVQNLCLQ